MSELHRYQSKLACALSPEALSSDSPGEWLREHHRWPAERVQPRLEISDLENLVAEASQAFGAGDTAADAFLTVRLHRALRLSRRQAADIRVWAWLGAHAFPDYVAHRWKPAAGSGLRSASRFTGNRVRQTFARLWWAAELTRNGNDYSLTEQLLSLGGFQDIHEAVFGRAFCGHRPAIAAFVDRVGSRAPAVVRQTAREFSNLLTTMVLEGMNEPELKATLGELADQVEAA